MIKDEKIIVVGALLFAAIIIAIVASLWDSNSNTDPRNGWVYIDNSSTYKTCDGTTLVYSKHNAISVIPNSPECM